MGQSVDVVVSEFRAASARLEGAAQRLKDGLASVDDETTQLLGADWKGGAASALAPPWDTWHGGAQQVVEGLQRMSELLSIAGKEYAKTDQAGADALGSTMQGSGGSAGSGGGASSGGGAGQATAGSSAGSTGGAGASQDTGSAEGLQQAMAAAMQLGQVAGQPLSQVGQGAAGLAQTIAGLAQEAAQGATEALQQQDSTPDDAASPGSARGTVPADSAPTGGADGPRAVERSGE